jgi:uracil-DNA glycosylase
MNLRQLRYLETMGIQVWQRRNAENKERMLAEEAEGGLRQAVKPLSPAGKTLEWGQLAMRVAGCTACALHCSRTQTVFGVGDREAQWLVIGEAPGADEDRQGEPFVGRAGQLLNGMLEALALQREQVYIANILKCRPPNNRDPLPEEIACCEPYLRRQVSLLQPRIILAVGRVAAQNLLQTSVPLARLRGKVHRYPDTAIPLVVTYHPAYLLRSPREKRRAWDDLRLALTVFRELC